jgi:predicted GNAT superfamily acetyltransferase
MKTAPKRSILGGAEAGAVRLRTAAPDDYARVIGVVDAWWDGRAMSAMLPRLFLVHFRETSLIAEVDGDLVGFLVGFLSPAVTEEAYAHFIGVHPDRRRRGVGRTLYERFFQVARAAGRRRVRCVTSPGNHASLAFHRGMGFHPCGGAGDGSGVPFHRDYDGPGEDRVLLAKEL